MKVTTISHNEINMEGSNDAIHWFVLNRETLSDIPFKHIRFRMVNDNKVLSAYNLSNFNTDEK